MTLLTLPETAHRLATTIGHLRAEIRRGRLRVVRLGKLIRVDEQDLVVYVEACKRGGDCSTSEDRSTGSLFVTPAPSSAYRQVRALVERRSARLERSATPTSGSTGRKAG
jgi:excisionase family DNA binding protein